MKLCDFDAGNNKPIFLIAGTCVVESEAMALNTAGQLKEICAELGVPLIYKSSFDKANRSSAGSFRGPGMEEGLRILDSFCLPGRCRTSSTKRSRLAIATS